MRDGKKSILMAYFTFCEAGVDHKVAALGTPIPLDVGDVPINRSSKAFAVNAEEIVVARGGHKLDLVSTQSGF